MGPIELNTYALATVDTIRITDLGTGETNEFTVPQSFAQNVPEPSTIALFGIGALGMFGYAARRRKVAA